MNWLLHHWGHILGLLIFTVVIVWLFWDLWRDSDFIYRGLKDIRERANGVKSSAQLTMLMGELRLFVRERCWHQHHYAGAKAVQDYLQGRLDSGPSITCPVCGRVSYHRTDIAEGYCGFCHEYTTPHSEIQVRLGNQGLAQGDGWND